MKTSRLPQLPPLGPVIFSVRTAGAAISMPVRWPSVAASPATRERDVRSTSVGTTARTGERARLLIEVTAQHAILSYVFLYNTGSQSSILFYVKGNI